MNHSTHSKLVSFIWRIADDCLRDVYVRGKYRDVILPMVVLRRLDTLLEPTKDAVLEEVRYQKEEMGEIELDDEPLRAASGYVFYNTSQWTLKKLHSTATNNQQILLANIDDYLRGFSSNVREIIGRFKLFEQMRHMADKQVLLDVIEKFISPYINLTPNDVEDPEGNILLGLSNLGMGYVFEELIRRFNEENNEEAGEHFTPREVIHLMTHLMFEAAELFRQIFQGQIRPMGRVKSVPGLAGFRFDEDDIRIAEREDPALRELTITELSKLTGWKHETIKGWVDGGFLQGREVEDRKHGMLVGLPELITFLSTYAVSADAAARLGSKSVWLMKPLNAAGVVAEGAHETSASTQRGVLFSIDALINVASNKPAKWRRVPVRSTKQKRGLEWGDLADSFRARVSNHD